MKVGAADRRAVAALADRYFAEQCARLGPIGGFAPPTPKRTATLDKLARLSAEAGRKAALRPTYRAQRLGAHDHVADDGKMVDRFRF